MAMHTAKASFQRITFEFLLNAVVFTVCIVFFSLKMPEMQDVSTIELYLVWPGIPIAVFYYFIRDFVGKGWGCWLIGVVAFCVAIKILDFPIMLTSLSLLTIAFLMWWRSYQVQKILGYLTSPELIALAKLNKKTDISAQCREYMERNGTCTAERENSGAIAHEE